jgi:hypothetical protein
MNEREGTVDKPNEAKRVRAVLSKQGEPDIHFELR